MTPATGRVFCVYGAAALKPAGTQTTPMARRPRSAGLQTGIAAEGRETPAADGEGARRRYGNAGPLVGTAGRRCQETPTFTHLGDTNFYALLTLSVLGRKSLI